MSRSPNHTSTPGCGATAGPVRAQPRAPVPALLTAVLCLCVAGETISLWLGQSREGLSAAPFPVQGDNEEAQTPGKGWVSSILRAHLPGASGADSAARPRPHHPRSPPAAGTAGARNLQHQGLSAGDTALQPPGDLRHEGAALQRWPQGTSHPDTGDAGERCPLAAGLGFGLTPPENDPFARVRSYHGYHLLLLGWGLSPLLRLPMATHLSRRTASPAPARTAPGGTPTPTSRRGTSAPPAREG